MEKSANIKLKGHKIWIHTTRYAPIGSTLVLIILLLLLLFTPIAPVHLPLDSTPDLKIEDNSFLFFTLIFVLCITLILLWLNHRKKEITLVLGNNHLELIDARSAQLLKFEEIESLEIQNDSFIWIKTTQEYFKLRFNQDQDLNPLFNHFSYLSTNGRLRVITNKN